MKTNFTLLVVALIAMTLTGCASINSNKVVKAPCGPTAGLTDPCGNSVPINTPQSIEGVQNSLIFGAGGARV